MGTSLTSLRRAWNLILRDPVGILLPAAVALWLQTAASIAFWRWIPTDPAVATMVVFLGHLAMGLAIVPLRLATLRAAAAMMALPVRGGRALLPMLGIQLVGGLVQAGLVAGVVAGGLGASTALAAYGWWSIAGLVMAAALVVSVAGSLAIRLLLAFAPAEVLAGGRSGARAMWASARDGRWQTAGALIVAGDLCTGLGALLCGAGALPGYPLSDVALLCAWEANR